MEVKTSEPRFSGFKDLQDMQHEVLTGKVIRCAIAQAKNYLEAYKMQIGLLINFGATSLEFKRLYIKNPMKKIS